MGGKIGLVFVVILGVVALACDARGFASPYQLGIIAANSGNFISSIISLSVDISTCDCLRMPMETTYDMFISCFQVILE